MSADHVSMDPTVERPSLCESCDFVRWVQGRHGQTYLLCRNEIIAAKYPPQPQVDCPGYVQKPLGSR